MQTLNQSHPGRSQSYKVCLQVQACRGPYQASMDPGTSWWITPLFLGIHSSR